MNKLYPIKFTPIEHETIWGKETYVISDLGVIDSIATNGWLEGNGIGDIIETYLEKIVGEEVFNLYGRQLPIQIKILELNDRISLQVNPDDEIAAQMYDCLGKSKLWYILETKDEAQIYLGLKEESNARELYDLCLTGNIESKLNSIKVKKGDAFYVPSGTIHSASAGLKILEIAEASELNLRLYDWGRNDSKRELHLEDAIDLINYKAYDPSLNLKPHNHDFLLSDAPEFNITKLVLTDTLHIYSENYKSFIIYTCIEGEAHIEIQKEEKYSLTKGESILIPAGMEDFYLVSDSCSAILLESYLKVEEKIDNYIDPTTEAFLEGEDYGGLEEEEEDFDGEEHGDHEHSKNCHCCHHEH